MSLQWSALGGQSTFLSPFWSMVWITVQFTSSLPSWKLTWNCLRTCGNSANWEQNSGSLRCNLRDYHRRKMLLKYSAHHHNGIDFQCICSSAHHPAYRSHSGRTGTIRQKMKLDFLSRQSQKITFKLGTYDAIADIGVWNASFWRTSEVIISAWTGCTIIFILIASI